MCGIIGVVGMPDAAKALVMGLKRLEYRGYDSAGIAVVTGKGLEIQRSVGVVANLEKTQSPVGTVGIGHTRWATHGPPTELNSHPHRDCTERLAVVHNGIVENYQELREALEARGHKFSSQTDTEVLAHLIEENHKGDLLAAVQAVLPMIEGSYALVVVSADAPDRIVCARMKSPLLLGVGEGRMLLASDATALLEHTRNVIFLEDGETAELTQEKVRLFDALRHPKIPVVRELPWNLEAAEKGGFDHFMLKEIHEIPEALHEVFRGRVGMIGERFDVEGSLPESAIRRAQRIVVLACGTSYYAGMVGRSVIEQMAGIPVEVHLASEYRYAPQTHQEGTLAIFVSQSGETADTLEAMRRARANGCRTLAMVNVVGSTLAREAEGVFYLRAGPEIGVASTKAFVNMVGGFYLLGLHLGTVLGHLTPDESKRLAAEMRTLPRLAQRALEQAGESRSLGEDFFHGAEHAFYLGRQINHGLAMEGALKIKEISYLHAEGYAAGELKHGPLALLTPDFPVVVCLSDKEPTYGVMVSNIGEVRARGAKVLAIATESDANIHKYVDHVIRVPATDALFYPIPACVSLYLLAYHAAKGRGCSIDRPRNLAKSVTVE
jgi:glucosamine--fructose-6-phosphate aminotransferase (isomerizing)